MPASLITFGVPLHVWPSHTQPDWLKGPTGSLQRSLYRSDPLPQRTDVGREMEKHRIMSLRCLAALSTIL